MSAADRRRRSARSTESWPSAACRSARLADRVGSTPFFAYDRDAAHRTRRAAARRRCPPGSSSSYAMKANPMPAVVQHLAGLVDSIDVASASEMRSRWTPRCRPDRVSFAGPGKTAAEIRQAVAAGRHARAGVGRPRPRRVIAAGEELGITPARRHPGQPRLRGQGLGHADGRRPAAVRRRRRAGAGAAARAARHRARHPRVPRVRRLAEPAAPRSCARRSAGPSTWCCGSPTCCPSRVRYLNLGGGFGIPYSDRDAPLDLDAVGDNLHDLVDGSSPTGCRTRGS